MHFKTADLSDDNEGRVQILLPGLSNFGGKTQFCGEIVTIKAFEDNSRVRELVRTDGAGKVLVIDNAASMRCAMLGDMLAAAAIENAWQGVVINGCIRDSIDIAAMEIGVKALSTHPLRSVKQGQGEINLELEFLGAVIRPGEFLYSDEDGILLASKALL